MKNTDGIKVANLTFKKEIIPGLSQWALHHHKGPLKTEEGCRKSESEIWRHYTISFEDGGGGYKPRNVGIL